MKKVAILFDLQPGNYNLLCTVLRMMNQSLSQQDKLYIFVQPNAKHIYENQKLQQFFKNLKPKFTLETYFYDISKNFGQNISQIIKKDTDAKLYVFKTTLPITNYPNSYQQDYSKNSAQQWFVLPSHNVVTVPNRKGKIIAVGQNQYLSAKDQQNVASFQRPINKMQPDYFVFGRQFIQTLLMINDFRQNNFAFVIQRAAMLKKPIQLGGKRVVKKYWNSIPQNRTYCLIPQYMMPIIKQVKDNKLYVLKIPTIVGNKYFNNSGWLTQIISKIDNVIFTKNDGTIVTGLERLNKISVRYDMDIYGSIYIAKMMQQLIQLNSKMKIDFYTKNPMIKYMFQKALKKNIFEVINWKDGPYINYSNYFDYDNKIEDVFKFDMNFFQVGSNDHDDSISKALSLLQPITRKDAVFQKSQPQIEDEIVMSCPASLQFLQKTAFFSKFYNQFIKKVNVKKIAFVLQPITLKGKDCNQQNLKLQKRLQACQKQIKQQLKDYQVSVKVSMYGAQQQMIDNILQICKKHKYFYLAGKNFISSVASNFQRTVVYRGINNDDIKELEKK